MAGWKDLLKRLKQLEKIPDTIAAEVAPKIDADLKAQFDKGVNAYGNAWKPLSESTLRRKGGDARILRRTDTLSSDVSAEAVGNSGIQMTVPNPGTYHQTGTRHMPARKILPDGTALPRKWQKYIQDALDRATDKVMK